MHYELIPQVKDKKPQRPPAASDLQDPGKAAGIYNSSTPRCEYMNNILTAFYSPYSESV
jgi:hypothetical protein